MHVGPRYIMKGERNQVKGERVSNMSKNIHRCGH